MPWSFAIIIRYKAKTTAEIIANVTIMCDFLEVQLGWVAFGNVEGDYFFNA